MRVQTEPPPESFSMPPLENLVAIAFIIAVVILILRPLLGTLKRKFRGRQQIGNAEGNEGYIIDFKNEPRVRSLLIQANEAYAEMKPIEAVSGEFLLDPFDKQRKKKKKNLIYTGLPAYPITIDPGIFPTRLSRILFTLLFPFGFRIRTFFRLYNEPCTRHLFTGALLLPEKKRRTLIEKKVIDKEGYLLDRETGNRVILDECWIKPDFSDVDFIKSEFHAYKQSEAVEKAAIAMSKTGQTFDKWFFYVLIAAFVAIVLVVLALSGIGQ